MQHHR